MALVRLPRRRVFFALWPDEPVRETLSVLARDLARECEGRVMRRPNIHLTLVFVGDVPPDRVETLEQLAAPVVAPAFELVIDTLNYWRHNRIAWAGAAAVPNALTLLVDALSGGVKAAGFRLDERPYVPHITLVRDARRAPAQRAIAPLAWPAREFALVESVRRKGRAAYDVLRRWPLRGV